MSAKLRKAANKDSHMATDAQGRPAKWTPAALGDMATAVLRSLPGGDA